MTARYDDSFEILVHVISETMGREALDRGIVLREAAGRLSFVYDGELTPKRNEQVSSALRGRLGPYARPDRVLVARGDSGADRLLSEPVRQWLTFGDQRIRYLDRRVVGIDWLDHSATERPSPKGPPRVVFGSLKGGVGRSTALCVAAVEFSEDNRNVLVIDLDLEAPGVGAMLLPEAALPPLGAVDYLCESSLTEDPSEILDLIVASSPLTKQTGGRVDVVPAAGRTPAGGGGVRDSLSRRRIQGTAGTRARLPRAESIAPTPRLFIRERRRE